MTSETHTPSVELPSGTTPRKSTRAKPSNAPLPDIDHTIKIPERMAASCWKALFICSVIAAVAFLDARDPLFRVYIANAADSVIYRLSLENIVSGISTAYQGLVGMTVHALSVE